MPTEVILPKVDMDMATGQISRWYVVDGAVVKKGDVLFEIETDKAAMEIEAPASGTIRDITGKQGIDIPVGEAVAWIYQEGEDPSGTSKNAAPAAVERAGLQEPLADTIVTPAEAQTASRAPASNSGAKHGAARATPLARRLAREAGLQIPAISGSGPRGRIVRVDVEAAVAAAKTKTTQASAPVSIPASRSMPKPSSDDQVLKLFEPDSYELVPHDNMRRTIARRLVEAKTTIPHFYLTLDCELDALLSLRAQLNAAAPKRVTEKGEAPGYRLSVNDMVIKALALSLRDLPDANVSWTDAGMLRHKHADVGVAVSIPGGLITPIIRKADVKTLSAISNEMRDLADRARNRTLKPEEYQGGSTAVSNLGMFGVRDFAAVINPPHASILAVGAGEERAVVRGGEVRIATMMSVTLSTDHRAVDGALAAELIGAFKRYVEDPIAMLV
jgi:pyruvate dehydrogenase E2 component (dihydrolipoamide acetyltransferase)